MRSLCLGSILLLALVGPGCRGDDDDDDDVTDGGGGGDGGGGEGNTVYQVQDPATGLGIGASVLLSGVVVTAVDKFGDRSGGFYVQEPEGGPYSGVYVFNQDLALADTLAPGDIVTVQGVIDEFALSSDTSGRTLTEIVPPNDGALTVTKTGTGNVPAPEQLDPRTLVDDAEAEKWEGVLIQLSTVAVA